MTTRTSSWPTGMPSWVDLGTPDMQSAKAFYGAVFGWEFSDSAEEFGGYSMAQINGGAAAGIGPLQDGAFNAWTLYFATDDIDKTQQTVTESGGTVMMPAGDVGDMGKLMIAAEPSGAVFGVWQAGTSIGAEVVNEPGTLTWEDLRSTNPDASRDFFNSVFGYRYHEVPMASGDYSTFAMPGEDAPCGGIGGMMGMNDMVSHWVVYFGVADTPAAIAAAEANGGTVFMPDTETPYGRMAGIADPTGARFCVIQADWSATPDRSG